MPTTEYVLVLDDDSHARLLHLCNEKLASGPVNVSSGPLLRARDALTWAIPTEAAAARAELVLDDWWTAKTLDVWPDFTEITAAVVGALRNTEPPSDESGQDG